ncbi:metallophosphoesterase [Lentilactobacillus parakefiri]|uniref:Phosphoesterase n=1 Tax=Lentilactobacillus parakefiri TaxID=152332 RepID=A0A269YM53_9LACO|nr:metallophosphoesterase [Lentilactobacillus parakefiri]PAK86647.1 YfcE family phosphodiesterase [Lentilactobacillus parakefiri]PAL01704.1 YfcE family phosphodiesterase [Lentilactobacillus parakefiri]TDG94219.1 hypothetical protein C5L28_000469 [Lentilactobacillus parakefiri]GAW72592.1 metallophosphoesterase [Lentilactobacillus parakefiri]
MKIVVVSDSHGDRGIIQELVSKYAGKVAGIFHCGDSELPLDDPLVSQLQIVRGNMDFAEFPEQVVQEVNGKRILLTHGHHQNVNGGLLNLELYARSLSADIVLFGHTHQLGATFDDQMLFVNPGSIADPRGQYASLGGTYAIISMDQKYYTVQYCNRQFEPVANLELRFPF